MLVKKRIFDAFSKFFNAQREQLFDLAQQLLAQKPNCTIEGRKVIETEQLTASIHFWEHHQLLDKNAIYQLYNTKGVKSHHLWELAFLLYVCKLAGVLPSKVYFISVNPDYTHTGGDIDPAQLLLIEDLSRAVKERLQKVEKAVNAALAFAVGPQPSIDALAEHSCRKKECLFLQKFYPPMPRFSVYDFKGINRDSLRELLAKGIVEMKDIPPEYVKTEAQALQMRLIATQGPIIDFPVLRHWLASLRYPLYLLDYEAFTGSIPVYERSRPFEHIVFQFSLHRILEEGAEPEHFEFLAEGREQPTARLLQALSTYLLDDTGSVLVWNDRFEKERNTEMGRHCPEYSPYLSRLNARIVDMQRLFLPEGGCFQQLEFEGRASIKKIFEVLVSNVDTHSSLQISDAMGAVLGWHRYLSGEEEERAKIALLRQQLLDYCRLDTLAMVLILKELFRVAS